jgi:hypothetical protein
MNKGVFILLPCLPVNVLTGTLAAVCFCPSLSVFEATLTGSIFVGVRPVAKGLSNKLSTDIVSKASDYSVGKMLIRWIMFELSKVMILVSKNYPPELPLLPG